MSNVATTSSSAQTEKQFVSTYLDLLSLSKDASPDQFNSTQDYNSIETLGPSLPPFKYNFPKNVSVSNERTLTLKFKSIKPPFKFSSELTDIPESFTIYRVKEELIKASEILSQAGAGPEHLKLMLKSKVVQDSSTLGDVSPEDVISFNCMVSAITATNTPDVSAGATDTPVGANAVETSNTNTSSDSPSTNTTRETEEISAGAWQQIHSILLQDLSNEQKAQALLSKFKHSV
ncbi:hypothetical protein JA1_001139 [Spathaspora sp. JA1]|nr:hypothetical protein JA1_001139 [Spathaspora sp. JA1]